MKIRKRGDASMGRNHTTRIVIAALTVLSAGAAQSAFGDSRVFIFRPGVVTSKQIGTVSVTRSIVIKYGLELRPNSKSRFIALDSRSVHLKPTLRTSEGNSVGFVIVTLDQPVLDVVITPKFMSKLRASVNLSAKQVMSQSANLGVEFTKEHGKVRISRVTLN